MRKVRATIRQINSGEKSHLALLYHKIFYSVIIWLKLYEIILYNFAKHYSNFMEIGTSTGPYRIDSLLGRGGMAEVYRAWHGGLHRFEALKALPPQMTFDRSFVERFLQEARTAAGLQHPNIAAIHAVSDVGAPQPYFTMELVEGGDLSDLIASRGRFSLPEALPILRQIALALDYAHGRGLMHRDVKPANVLLQNNSSVKVVDFGIARAQEDGGGTRLTKTGMIVGTPEYMSPEQAGSGEVVDARTDQYSLGVIAYEMLCGKPPFQAQNDTSMLSVIMQHVRDAPRPPIEAVPGLPANASNAILKALAKKPIERFASCSEFVSALEGTIPVPLPKPFPGPGPIPRKKNWLWPAALGVAMLTGTGLVSYGLFARNDTVEVSAPSSSSTSSTGSMTPVKSDAAPNVKTQMGSTVPLSASQTKTPGVQISVPDLVGKSESQAREIIKAKSLSADVTTGYSDAFDAQQVMSQFPTAGTGVDKSSPVKLRISLGPNLKEKARLAALKEKREEAAAQAAQEQQAEAADTQAILEAVDTHQRAWEQLNLDVYMSGYSLDARIFSNHRWYSYDEHYSNERELFANGGTINVTRSPASVDIEGGTANVSFRSTFQRWGGKGNFKSTGRQKFKMRKVDGKWLITEDVFNKS